MVPALFALILLAVPAHAEDAYGRLLNQGIGQLEVGWADEEPEVLQAARRTFQAALRAAGESPTRQAEARKLLAKVAELLGDAEVAGSGREEARRLFEERLAISDMNQAWEARPASWLRFDERVEATDWERYEELLAEIRADQAKEGEHAAALATAERLLLIRAERLHPEHRFVAQVHEWRAEALENLGDRVGAVRAREEALRVIEKTRVAGHLGPRRRLEEARARLAAQGPGRPHRAERPGMVARFLAWARGREAVRPLPRKAGPGEVRIHQMTSDVDWVAFSPDGAHLLAWAPGTQQALRRWRVADGSPAGAWEPPEGRMVTPALSRDGGTVYVGHAAGAAAIDLATGDTTRIFRVPEDGCYLGQLEVADGGKSLVGFGDIGCRGWLWRWDLGRDRPARGHAAAADQPIRAWPGGGVLAAGGRLGLLRWDPRTWVRQGHMESAGQGLWDLQVAPDGSRVLKVARDGQLALTDVATNRVRSLPTQVIRGSAAAFTPDGERLVVTGWDWRVRVFDLARDQVVATFLAHGLPPDAVAVSPDGRFAASGGRDGRVVLWRLRGA